LGAAPVVGGALKRLGGASMGAALLTDHNPDHAEAHLDEQGQAVWRQPMLQRSTDNAVGGLLSGPTWQPGQTSAPSEPGSRNMNELPICIGILKSVLSVTRFVTILPCSNFAQGCTPTANLLPT